MTRSLLSGRFGPPGTGPAAKDDVGVGLLKRRQLCLEVVQLLHRPSRTNDVEDRVEGITASRGDCPARGWRLGIDTTTV
jgi:hypothetical protein